MKPLVATALSSVLASVLAVSANGQTPPYFPKDLTPAGVAAADNHLDLELVDAAAAKDFVTEENNRSLEILTNDPRYETYRQKAFAILSATDRIAAPGFQGDGIGNFWQDAANPKGIWRRTSLTSYQSGTPVWETLLDMDALSKVEGRDYVFKGADCLAPAETRCLVYLSDGGKDAVIVREFDTVSKTFVVGGFSLPEGKHRIDWLNGSTLLVATDFGPDKGVSTLTESGYPYVVKALGRGQTFSEAYEVFRGSVTDGGYGVSPFVLRDAKGAPLAVMINRPLDTFNAETYRVSDAKPNLYDLPLRSTIYGAQNGHLIFSIEQDWRDFKEGALLSANLDDLSAATVIFQPNARQSIDGVAVLDDRLVASIYDNVRGRIIVFKASAGQGWTASNIAIPDNSASHLGAVSRASGKVFYSYEGFLTPTTLNLMDTQSESTTIVRQNPARFDASTHVVEQFEATSSDGAKIPYFLVRPKNTPYNGKTATIMYGYGGFNVSKPPIYIPEMGKLWLENGGAYVIANIRGGGEFGPAWHQAVLKGNRQLAFDDFAAVGRDLASRKIADAKHLGIYGRSNGGVLTSVSITQHPELFNAAVIESPLIDMLRYQELPPGASWIGEYGDPRILEDATFIAKYSAYQQLRQGVNYPRVYITTNTRDDRVHPAHARKFAARLKDLGIDHLYYEETAGGHSNDADPVANARRWARHYVYLTQQLMDSVK